MKHEKIYLGYASVARVDGTGRLYRHSFFLRFFKTKTGKPYAPYIEAGCRSLSFREARAHWKNRPARPWVSPWNNIVYNQAALRLVARGELRWLRVRAEHARKSKKKTRRKK